MKSNKASKLIFVVLIACAFKVQGQIPSRSFDLGINGFYNTSPLTITQGGNGISGYFKKFHFSGNLGYFIFDNSVAGLRFNSNYEYFEVEGQFFNSTTGQYQPYILIEKTNVYGVYGRYYSDYSKSIAAFAHLEYGRGTNLISVTEENALGDIVQKEYTRDLEDFAIGLGIALRPSENIGLELMALRRTQYESYIPPSATTNVLQIETYLGYEFRIGLRINLNFTELLARNRSKKYPFDPEFSK